LGVPPTPFDTWLDSPRVDAEKLKQLEKTTRYEPAEVERRLFREWMDGGYFHPAAEGSPAENFSVAIPPPNVTGALHMGHALNGAMQDALVRYMRKKEATTTQERRAAYHLFCERPMRIPPEQLRYVLQEDMWNL